MCLFPQVRSIDRACCQAHAESAVDGVRRATVTAGGAYSIPAGHDAWVEGYETFVGYELMSPATYAKPA